jgi:DNA-binding phage protein
LKGFRSFAFFSAELPFPDAFPMAVRDLANAPGLARAADEARMDRAALSRALKPGAEPGFETVRRMLGALGVRLEVRAPSAHP